jgi:hypothetical protein
MTIPAETGWKWLASGNPPRLKAPPPADSPQPLDLEVQIGATYSVALTQKKPLTWCRRGYHYYIGPDLFTSLRYGGAGPWLAQVKGSGELQVGAEKAVAQDLTILALIDASPVLTDWCHHFHIIVASPSALPQLHAACLTRAAHEAWDSAPSGGLRWQEYFQKRLQGWYKLFAEQLAGLPVLR